MGLKLKVIGQGRWSILVCVFFGLPRLLLMVATICYHCDVIIAAWLGEARIVAATLEGNARLLFWQWALPEYSACGRANAVSMLSILRRLQLYTKPLILVMILGYFGLFSVVWGINQVICIKGSEVSAPLFWGLQISYN